MEELCSESLGLWVWMVGKGGIAGKAKSGSRGAMAEKVGRLWRL